MDHAAPGRLWVRLMKRHRVERDAAVPCTRDDPEAAPFDYMEISYIFPEDEKKAARPRDPRWDA